MVPPSGGLKNEDEDPGTVAPKTTSVEGASSGIAQLSDERPWVIGPYRIVYTIGRGVTGMVYLAEQARPVHRRVTLKIIRTGVDAREMISRFSDEQRALALERHPGIAEVYDAGVTDRGRPYFVTEHCPGVPITEYCELSRLTTCERLTLFTQVCAAVEHAHRLGIVHGDIKPADVIVRNQDGRPIVKITDFIVAKLAHSRPARRERSERLDRPASTPVRGSPEPGRRVSNDAGHVDRGTDVDSLGALLHELLVGAPPRAAAPLEARGDELLERTRCKDAVMRGESWTRETTSARATRSASAPRRPRAALERERELVRILRKATDRVPERRFTGVRELSRELDRYIAVDAARRRATPLGTLVHESVSAGAAAAAFFIVFLLGFALGGLLDGRSRLESDQSVAIRSPRPSSLPETVTPPPTPAESAAPAGESAVPAVAALRESRTEALPEPPGREELPGWEERYLDLRRDLSLHALHGHEDDVDCVAFSADGRLVASGSKDRTVRLWNAATGRHLATLEGHGGGVLCVEFSPDGTLLASGSTDHAVRLWDIADVQTEEIETGTVPSGDLQHGRLLATLDGHEDDVDTLAFRPDGRHLASGSLDQTVRLWDVETRLLVGAQDFNRGPLRRIAFTRDGQRLLAAFSTGALLILDPVTLYPEVRLGAREREINGFAVDAGGARAVSCAVDGSIRLWSLPSGEIFRTLEDGRGLTSGLALRPGGEQVASASGDGSIRIWDADAGALVTVLVGHEGAVHDIEYSPDGGQIASASRDHTVRIWDAETTGAKVALEGRPGGVSALDVSHDGRLVAAGGDDGTAWLWDSATGDLLATLKGHTETVWDVAFSPSDRLLTTAALDDVVLWSMETREQVAVLSGHGDAVMALGYHPDGRLLATGARSGIVRLWHIASRAVVTTFSGHRDSVRFVTFRPDGRRLATASHDGTVRVWDVATEKLVATVPVDGGQVLCLAYSRDGEVLATGSEDHAVRLWNAETGELRAVLRGHRDVIRSLELSPNGSRLVSASRDGTLRFWNPDTRTQIGLLESPSGELTCFSFSPGGSRLIVGTDHIEVWDTELASVQSLWRGAARRRLVERAPELRDPR